MKTLLYLAITIAVGSSALYAQPKIQIEEGTKLDLGTINRGKVVEKQVTLKNVGDQTLVLGRVDASCGCTGTLISSDKLAPGEKGTLKITFNSRSFNGPVHKTVTVNSNAANMPSAVIEFTATVTEEVSVIPVQIFFRDAEVGRLTTSTVTVQNKGKENLTLKGFTTQLQGFNLKLPEKPIEPGQSAQIVAEFKPKAVTNLLNDAVIVKTNNALQPEVVIHIYGNVKEFKFQ